jgi:putative nucleotidyltransferase-like protein
MHGALPVSTWLAQEVGAEILREVSAHCEPAAIPLLPVKGIVTSRLLYRDVAERPITDVDVRVRRRDLGKFQRVAAAAGWRCLRVAWSYWNLTYDFGPLSLDVEACVGPPGLCALSVDAMLDRSERLEIAPGLRVSVPEIHDHAVLLTINAFKDKIVTAAPWAIADLERIVVQPCFRRDLFIERVSQSRITTIAWIIAAWLESVRGSSAWGAIRLAIESGGNVRRTYAKLFQRQLATVGPAPMLLRLLARAGADSSLMQIGALAGALAWTVEMRLRAGPTTFRC